MTKRFKDIEVSADIGQVRLYTTDTDYEDYGSYELLNLLNKQDLRIQQLEEYIKERCEYQCEECIVLIVRIEGGSNY